MESDKNNNEELTCLEVITHLFTSRKFAECLKRLEHYSSLNLIGINQTKIFKASCWTHLYERQNEAMKLLQEVVQEEPENPFVHFEIGVSLYLNGEFKKSVNEFLIAANLYSAFQESSYTYIDYATRLTNVLEASESLFTSGKALQAVDLALTAIQIDESNTSIQRVVKAKIENFLFRVVKQHENRILLKHYNVEHFKLLEQLIAEGNFDKASSMFAPDESRYTAYEWYLKGFYLYRFGQLKGALECFIKSLEVDPTITKVQEIKVKTEKIIQLMDEATFDMQAGKNLIAIEKLSYAQKIDPENLRILQGIYFQLSACKYKEDMKDEAFRDYLQFEALQNITGLVMNGFKF